ncbi:Carbapenem-hydrolyzing beta-lactamase Sme-1 precursor [Botrimarina colliarenosi]|uniref:beta-lactamase n=1 Tax=Botrimarina colliarenosi TaxID=2528001 RepID=A0A5C6A2P2_9BACT|nr:serine hydrolase [Botrimarina colliarenosi]TWT93461.1 Carbapenem-hydrolyzing beta-lactamase Sme-1 precursor [Botrimarina colliarenosi]
MTLPNQIAELVESTPARVGLCVVHASGAPGFGYREEEVFTQASAIKIPILGTLNRLAADGRLALSETLPVDPSDGVGGCGVLQNFLPGASRLALADLATLMIVLSDNVATNLLIERIGFDAVNELIEDMHGSEATRLRRKMIDLEARKVGRENTATPRDAAVHMLRLAENANAGDPAALATRRTLRLKKESPVTAALPKDLLLATKPGMLDGLRTEWSLVQDEGGGVDYAMALMADGADDAVLEPLFRRLAATIHSVVTR